MAFFYSLRWNFKFLFLLFLLVVSLGTAQAQPAEEEAIKQSVQAMFATLTRGDMKSAQALWIEKAEKYPFFERMIGSYQASGTDLQFAKAKFTRWNIKGDSANVLLHFERQWRDKKQQSRNRKTLFGMCVLKNKTALGNGRGGVVLIITF